MYVFVIKLPCERCFGFIYSFFFRDVFLKDIRGPWLISQRHRSCQRLLSQFAYHIHLKEDFGDTFFWGVLVLGQVHEVAHHTVDGVHDLHHFLLGYEAVIVEVVQAERP